MSDRSDQQSAGRERERRQVVAGALGDHEVDAHAHGGREREQGAEQVERRSGDVDDQHETDDRDGRTPQHERGRRPSCAQPDERDEHDRGEVLDEQGDGDRHPLHRREEEELTAEHGDQTEARG